MSAAVFLLLLTLSVHARAAGDGSYVQALRGVLLEDHADIRDPVWILPASGFKVADVVAALARQLPALDAPSAVEAEYILGRIGARAAAAVPALTERLASSPDIDVRYEAVRALGRIGPAARPALIALSAAVAEPDADLRAAAREAIKRVAPDQGLPGRP